MINRNFHSRLIDYYNSNRIKDANRLIMTELALVLIKSKKDFVDLLNESDILAYDVMSDSKLIDLYVSNIDTNKKLRLGTALLINMHNKQMSFDGEDEVSNDGVRVSAYVLDDYFSAEGTMYSSDDYDAPTIGGTMYSSEEEEEYSNVIPGLGQAIAGAVGGVATLGTKIAEGQQKKKYGMFDMASKKQDAKATMTQQILAQRLAETENKKKEDEQKQKTTRTLLIVGGSVLGVVAIIVTIYLIRKNKKQ